MLHIANKSQGSGINVFQSPPPKEIVTLPAGCVAEGNDSPNSRQFPLMTSLSRSTSLQGALSAKCQMLVFPGKSSSLNGGGWFLFVKMGTCLIVDIIF